MAVNTRSHSSNPHPLTFLLEFKGVFLPLELPPEIERSSESQFHLCVRIIQLDSTLLIGLSRDGAQRGQQ